MIDSKMWLVRNFDKGLLGGACLWLGLAISGFLSPNEGHALRSHLEADLQGIKEYVSTQKTPKFEEVDWEASLRQRLHPTNLEAKTLPAWSLHKRPNVICKYNVPPPNTFKTAHFAPDNVTTKAFRDRIEVSWTESSYNNTVKIAKYEIWRSKNAGPAKLVKASDDCDLERYIDKDVEQGRVYKYWIKSFAELDTDWGPIARLISRGQKLSLDAKKRFRESSSVKTKLLRSKILIPIIVSPKGEYDPKSGETAEEYLARRAKVNFKIGLWNPKHPKSWIFKHYLNVEEGKPVGSLVTKNGENHDFRMGVLHKARVIAPKMKKGAFEGAAFVVEVKYADETIEVFDSREEFSRPGR